MSNLRHGKADSRVYRIWLGMKQRCLNPKYHSYGWYGGRGISICQEWIDDFGAFYRDMGDPPTEDHSIERRETNGNYTKENCYWAVLLEQANNRRSNVTITYLGRTQTAAQWGREIGISGELIAKRIKRGLTAQAALSTAGVRRRTIPAP